MNPALSEPDLIRKADRLCIFRQDGFHGERPLFQFAVLCPHQRAELPGPDILRFAELRKACAERIKQVALLQIISTLSLLENPYRKNQIDKIIPG